MAAEMTIDMTKTFSGRAPIQARLSLCGRGLDRLDSIRSVRVRQNDHSPIRCRTRMAGRRENPVPVEDLARYEVGGQGLSARPTDRVTCRKTMPSFPRIPLPGTSAMDWEHWRPMTGTAELLRWWNCSNCKGLKRRNRENCPVGNSSGWRLPGRSRRGPNCSCSMNPCRRWTRRPVFNLEGNSEFC